MGPIAPTNGHSFGSARGEVWVLVPYCGRIRKVKLADARSGEGF